jgi:hypothetical protein
MALVAVMFSACQESLEEKCAKEVQMYNQKNCPAKMSENIIMDSISFDASTHTINYFYTLTGFADTIIVDQQKEVRETLLGELKNSPGLAAYKEAGYKFHYRYMSQKHPEEVLYDMLFTSKDYNKEE